MENIYFLLLSLFSINLMNSLLVPNVPNGTIERIEKLTPKYVNVRNIDIRLPEGYTPQKKVYEVMKEKGVTEKS